MNPYFWRSRLLYGGGGGGFTTLGDAIAAQSPLIWLKLNDAGTATAADYGSRGVAATGVSISLPRNIAGPDGDSYVRLDGTSDYYSLPDAADLSITKANGMTVAVAHRHIAIDGADTLWSKAVAGGVEYIFDHGGTSSAFRAVWGQAASSSSYSENRGAAAPALNVWHYTIVRYEVDGGISVFQDSTVPDTSLNVNKVGTASEAGTGTLQVGGWSAFAGYRHDGYLAHFAQWNSAISDASVLALMNTALAEGWAYVPA